MKPPLGFYTESALVYTKHSCRSFVAGVSNIYLSKRAEKEGKTVQWFRGIFV